MKGYFGKFSKDPVDGLKLISSCQNLCVELLMAQQKVTYFNYFEDW